MIKDKILKRLGICMEDEFGNSQDYPVVNVYDVDDESYIMLDHPWITKALIKEQVYLMKKGVRSCFFDTVYIGEGNINGVIDFFNKYLKENGMFSVWEYAKFGGVESDNIADIYGCKYKWMTGIIEELSWHEETLCLADPIKGMLFGYSFSEIDKYFKEGNYEIENSLFPSTETNQQVFDDVFRLFSIAEGRTVQIHNRNMKDIKFKVSKRKMQRNLALSFYVDSKMIHDYFEQEMRHKFDMYCIVIKGEKSSIVTLFEYKWMMLLFCQVINERYPIQMSYYILAKLFGYSDEHIDETIHRSVIEVK